MTEERGLRARAQQHQQPGQDVDRTPSGPTLGERMEALAPALQKAMPVGLEARQILRDVEMMVRKVPQLMHCDPATVLGAAMTCAQLGLRPGVLGQAWILPYWDGRERRSVATFVPGYQGLIQLAFRHPAVARVFSRPIYAGDTWSVRYGLEDTLEHVPHPDREPGRPVVAAYSVFRLANGGTGFLDMSKPELDAWRNMFAPRGKPVDGVRPIVGPWAKPDGTREREAMELKTTTRRLLLREVPLSIELLSGLAADGGVRRETDPEARPEDVTGFTEDAPAQPGPDGDVQDAEELP